MYATIKGRFMNTKKNILKVFVFVLFLFIFDRGFFLLFQTLEGSFYNKKEIQRVFVRKRDFNRSFLKIPKGTYSTIIMGSSRTFRGIHPFYFQQKLGENAFKIARAGVWCKFNYYFYKEYKKYAGIPKVAVYGLDYFMFRKKSQLYNLQAVMGGNRELEPYQGGISLLMSNKERINSFYKSYLDYLDNRIRKRKKKKQPLKVVDPFVGYPRKLKLKTRRPSTFRQFEYIPYPGEEGIFLSKLLEEWQRDGVKVILVIIPEHQGTYESNFEQRPFLQDIAKISKTFNNVFFYNYNRPDMFDLSNPDYYQDGGYGKTNSHLSLNGARIFNRQFLKDIKKYYQ